MKKKVTTILALALFSTVLVGSANAVFIDGTINLRADFEPLIGTNPASLDIATGIDFFDATPSLVDDQLDVGTKTGSFTTVGDIGTITDFVFNPVNSGWFTLWTVDNFSFRLESWTITGQNSTNLGILGYGTVFDSGPTPYDPTPGVWNFTGQTTNGVTHGWSATSSASPVPEPATMILIGTGLVGLVGTRIRRRKK